MTDDNVIKFRPVDAEDDAANATVQTTRATDTVFFRFQIITADGKEANVSRLIHREDLRRLPLLVGDTFGDMRRDVERLMIDRALFGDLDE